MIKQGAKKAVPTVLAVYTGRGLDGAISALFQDILPHVRLANLIDDSLIADVVAAGRVPESVTKRLIGYFLNAGDIGADVILNTCSSVGELVELGRRFTDVPIVRIDEPMAEAAVERFSRIGVMATLPSTLQPTLRLIESKGNEIRKTISAVDGLAEGAYDALISGRPEEHDAMILETAAKIASSVDGIVLAQGSMARIADKLEERAGKPVLSSPRMAVEAIADILDKKGKTR
jgi:Asp/Glu/hydantoin racemase